MSNSRLVFAIKNGILVHSSDTHILDSDQFNCIKCGHTLHLTKSGFFTATVEHSCNCSNVDILPFIARQLVLQYKYLDVPGVYIDGSFRYTLKFDKLEILPDLSPVVSLIGHISDTNVYLNFIVSDTLVSADSNTINDYVLTIHIPKNKSWSYDDYPLLIQELSQWIMGYEDLSSKVWQSLPLHIIELTSEINTCKNGVSLDNLEVYESRLTIDDLDMYQRGLGTEEEKQWYSEAITYTNLLSMCGWNGCLYASKCRTCKKFADSICSLVKLPKFMP